MLPEITATNWAYQLRCHIVCNSYLFLYCMYVAVHSVIVTLNNTMHLQATNDAKWNIIREELFDGSCTNGSRAPLYNPYQVQVNSSAGYMNDCNPHNQQRCAMGDLSGKLGMFASKANSIPHKTYSFYDENLFLTGKYTSELNKLYVCIYIFLQ